MADQVDSTSTASALPNSEASNPRHLNLGWSELTKRFLSLIRFSHTLFALPFAALACVLSISTPGHVLPTLPWVLLRLLGVLLCMVFARSAAMAFNRLVDARIDAGNPRTAGRHLPAGELSAKQVWLFFLGTSTGFVASCTLFLPNWLPLAAAVPVLAWICCYSFTKRFTSGAHLWLGVSLALSPICSWVAIRGETVAQNPADLLPSVALALAIALWVAGFDIIYACQDAEFDRGEGLKSIPAKFGIAGALRVSAAFHCGMLLVLGFLPWGFPVLSLGWLYGAGLLVVAGLVIRQHAIVRPDDLRRVGEAFFTINIVISMGLSLVIALDSCLR